MTQNLGSLPARSGQAPATATHRPTSTDTLHFAEDPSLRALLHPDVVIRPGIDYLACALVNVPRAEGEGFRTMPNQRSFMIRGIPCLVMTRGKATPGARDSAQLVTLQIDKACDPIAAKVHMRADELNASDEELERLTAPGANVPRPKGSK